MSRCLCELDTGIIAKLKENEMDKEKDNDKSFKRKLFLMDIMILLALALIGVLGWKSLEKDSIITEKVLELSQINGVNFQTKTNSLFGVKFVKPMK